MADGAAIAKQPTTSQLVRLTRPVEPITIPGLPEGHPTPKELVKLVLKPPSQ